MLMLIDGRACFAGEGEPIILLGEAWLGLGTERLVTSAFNYSRVSSWLYPGLFIHSCDLISSIVGLALPS